MDAPWKDWIPGVLNKAQMGQFCEERFIVGDGTPDVADHSSIELTLSNEAFKMISGSVKPHGGLDYGGFVLREKLAERFAVSKEGTLLKARETYVFRLREKLRPLLAEGKIHGQATAKSSVGRVDVLARLIVDGMDSYEGFNPAGLKQGSGDMYLEVTPITFNVLVKEGIGLSQLRLFYGEPAHAEMEGDELFQTILHGAGQRNGSLSVELTNMCIRGGQAAAFQARNPAEGDDPIPLWKEDEGKKPDPCRYWNFISSNPSRRLKIERDKFYLLRSKERISVPRGIAIYCRASDETIGEMRIHYAGFAHPFFGWDRTDEEGTPLIFEVRGHQVDVTLADGEKMANLTFYRMSEDCAEEDDQGKKADDPYQKQNLELSKFFGQWPDKVKISKDGTVEPA